MMENQLFRCTKAMLNTCWRMSPSVFKSPAVTVSPSTRLLSSISYLNGHCHTKRRFEETLTKVPIDYTHRHKSNNFLLNPSLGPLSIAASALAPIYVPVRNYQSVLRPRLHCKGCFYVWRHGRKFVECSDVPSHKQMKKVATRKVWLEDYSRGKIHVAMKWNRDLKRIAHRHVDKTVISHNWLASRIGKDI